MSSQTWFLKVGEKIHGPISADRLVSLTEQGKIRPETLVSRDRAIWLPAVHVGGLKFPPSVEKGTAGLAARTGSPAPFNVERPPVALREGLDQRQHRRRVLTGTIAVLATLCCFGGLAISVRTIPPTDDVTDSQVHPAKMTFRPGEAGTEPLVTGEAVKEPSAIRSHTGKIRVGLERLGYSPNRCLVCSTSRPADAIAKWSDRRGFGLCRRCGDEYAEWRQVLTNAATGLPPTESATLAANRFEATMEAHFGRSDDEARLGLGLMLLGGKFASSEWDVITSGETDAKADAEWGELDSESRDRLAKSGSLYFYEDTVDDADLRTLSRGTSVIEHLHSLDLGRAVLADECLIHVKPFKNMRVLNLWASSAGDAGMVHVGALVGLKKLYLGNTRISDAGLASLATLRELEDLDLCGTAVGDLGLEHLKSNVNLRWLLLCGTRISDDGLDSLAALRDLERLNLGGTQISDRGLGVLGRLPQLQSLGLSRTKVTDGWVAHLNRAASLKDVTLTGTAFTDDGLRLLSEVPGVRESLETLTLDDCRITDAGVAYLPRFRNLKKLDIGRAEASDAGIEHLTKLESLKELSFNAWRISETGQKQLNRALEGCRVVPCWR